MQRGSALNCLLIPSESFRIERGSFCVFSRHRGGHKNFQGVRQLVYCRGIRGATTVEQNDRNDIISATTELLQLMICQNDLQTEDIASAFFSLTEDLDAEFPAVAARLLGWTEVPLMCVREIPVPGSLSKCIRVLLHVNTTRNPSEIQHVYIRNAVNLRTTIAAQE